MEQIKETILHFGRPNANGKIYDANDFETTSTVPVMVERASNNGTPFLEQAGRANVVKNMDTLDATITIDGAHKDFALSKLEEGQRFVASGMGHVDESGYIREYKLMRIIITADPANIY